MTSEQRPDLTPQIAEWQRRLAHQPGGAGFEPGPLLASCLAGVLDPSQVIFLDWTSAESSHYDLTDGSLFALMAGFAVKVEWLSLPRGRDSFQRREQHSVDIAFHPLTELPIIRLHFDNVFAETSPEPKAVQLEGVGWSQALPLARRYQPMIDYFQEVRSALVAAASPTATVPDG
jgi:hypothetical protein